MNDEEFLILDDDDKDLTHAKPDSPKASDVQSISETSASIGSLGGLISRIKGILGEGIGKISSSISETSEKKAAKVTPTDELILDDGSLEKVRPIAGESADSADFMEAELVVDGVEQFGWNLRGMDCPDCAMKATRAVNRLPGVDQVIISATEGSIRSVSYTHLTLPTICSV